MSPASSSLVDTRILSPARVDDRLERQRPAEHAPQPSALAADCGGRSQGITRTSSFPTTRRRNGRAQSPGRAGEQPRFISFPKEKRRCLTQDRARTIRVRRRPSYSPVPRWPGLPSSTRSSSVPCRSASRATAGLPRGSCWPDGIGRPQPGGVPTAAAVPGAGPTGSAPFASTTPAPVRVAPPGLRTRTDRARGQDHWPAVPRARPRR